MKRLRKIIFAVTLSLALCGSAMSGWAAPAPPCLAATVPHYYIYVDNYTYEVTAEQYQGALSRQYDKKELVRYLQEILGERMPDKFSVISGRVITTEEDIPVTSDDNTQEDDSDFLIRDGVLLSYRGEALEVNVPDGVTTISALAFCSPKIKSVRIPSSVKAIRKYAFYRCTSLKYIVFDKENTTCENNIIYDCEKLTNVVAPKGSKAYEYAKKNDIPVTTTETPCCSVSHSYLLVGDKEKNVIFNNFQSVSWKSSKKKIVSVSKGGTLQAKKKGKATITATVNGKKYRYKVTVYNKSIKKRLHQITKSCIKKDMSRYEKVRAVHNWLIRNVKYDYYRYQTGSIPRVSHTAKGALIKKVAVCDGYAHAFQMIMKKLKIPCKFVVGSSQGIGHGWNMVKLGGKWYHIDVTFDDPIVNESNNNTIPRYTYFLKSSSTMSKSHKWKKSKYPKCKSKKYE